MRDTTPPPLVALEIKVNSVNHMQTPCNLQPDTYLGWLESLFQPNSSPQLRDHFLSLLISQPGGSSLRVQWRVWTLVLWGRCQTLQVHQQPHIGFYIHQPGCSWLVASRQSKVFELVTAKRGSRESVWFIIGLAETDFFTIVQKTVENTVFFVTCVE